MNTGLIATYDTHARAEDMIRELDRAGFDMKRLSIIGRGYHSEDHPVGFYTRGDRMKTWGGVGAFWGALWGMLFGAALFWIPGIGLLGAAGPFVHVLAGTLEGAALLGGASVLGAALATIGVPGDSIVRYERSLRADRYLLIVHGTPEEIDMARAIAGRTGASDVGAFDGGAENAASAGSEAATE